MTIQKRLEELGITLPKALAPVANYVPFVRSGNMLFVSGQVSVDGDNWITGTLGKDVSQEEGYAAAKACGINLLAQVKKALDGDLDRVTRVVKLGIFVNCTDSYTDQPVVANGASDLMVEVFGDKGMHARAAVGTNALPRGVAVEVEGVFEVE